MLSIQSCLNTVQTQGRITENKCIRSFNSCREFGQSRLIFALKWLCIYCWQERFVLTNACTSAGLRRWLISRAAERLSEGFSRTSPVTCDSQQRSEKSTKIKTLLRVGGFAFNAVWVTQLRDDGVVFDEQKLRHFCFAPKSMFTLCVIIECTFQTSLKFIL